MSAAICTDALGFCASSPPPSNRRVPCLLCRAGDVHMPSQQCQPMLRGGRPLVLHCHTEPHRQRQAAGGCNLLLALAAAAAATPLRPCLCDSTSLPAALRWEMTAGWRRWLLAAAPAATTCAACCPTSRPACRWLPTPACHPCRLPTCSVCWSGSRTASAASWLINARHSMTPWRGGRLPQQPWPAGAVHGLGHDTSCPLPPPP